MYRSHTYSQIASPYLAMANNPVSTIDPDGGYTSFPSNEFGRGFRGAMRKQEEYSIGAGVYDREAVQKRYQNELDELAKHFLDYDYGNGKDVEGYLNAVNTLNAEYAGMATHSGYALAYRNGGEYLTASQAVLNQNTLGRNQKVVNAQYARNDDSHYVDYSNFDMLGKFAQANTTRTNSHEMHTTKVFFWFNGDGSFLDTQVKTTYLDGTSVSNFFDVNGNLTASYSRSGDNVVQTFGGEGNATSSTGETTSIGIANTESGRKYGGDGSGSLMDNTLKVLDVINQFNPIANAMDAVSGYIWGKDRLGNKQSLTETTLKAAGIVPIGKLGGLGANAFKSIGQHGVNQAITRGFSPQSILKIVKEGDAVSAMGKYGPQIRYTLGGNTVVVNQSGKVISAFSNSPGTRNGLGKGFFIPF